MPIPKNLLAQFEENNFYHVLCKSTSDRKLFLNDGDKHFFLQRYDDLLYQFVNTHAYCLLCDHAHFLIQPRSIDSIEKFLGECAPKFITRTHTKFLLSNSTAMFHELIEQQFNRLFISHSLKCNRLHDQFGHLFLRPFKRKSVQDSRLAQLMIYIHANPLKHKIIEDFTNYKWSSYQEILSDAPTQLCRNEVLDWFGGKENFERMHREQNLHYFNHPDSIE